ncbi:protein SCO1/2 [Nitrosospira sp. Nsp2]|uniref:SCO family protein n=1 Tax=Nitrosospira sp. Nsp2 TaxID=136548 RepID=UPI000D2FFE55|nr:SCO family protein [Nitrosospira sp. Nsp2]PTR14175.1 protein SCO1/2 [Nitrosospira sp. Nsp2]
MWLGAGTVLLAAGTAGASSRWGEDYFPNVPLITQNGEVIRFYDDLLKDKAVVINLIYTNCKDRCPLETARLGQVKRLLGDRVGTDIFFYSISIDPEHDTAEVLKAYADSFGAGPGWLFLTGNEADIKLISKKLGLSSINDSADRDGHLPSLMIGEASTGQWMRLSAVDDPRFLATKISTFLSDWNNSQGTGKSYSAARPIQGLDAGSYLFRTRCSACHTVGQGDGLGPDLLGVARVRDRAWLARFIKTPEEMLAEKDPIAMELFIRYRGVRMPNLRLGDGDVETLIQYLETQTVAHESGERENAAASSMKSLKRPPRVERPRPERGENDEH